MNLHEYQAKEILLKFGLPLLKGKSYINSLDGIEDDLDNMKGPPWVVKSQIHAGGRGAGYFKNSFNEKGGVQVVNKKSDVVSIASSSHLVNCVIGFKFKSSSFKSKSLYSFLKDWIFSEKFSINLI